MGLKLIIIIITYLFSCKTVNRNSQIKKSNTKPIINSNQPISRYKHFYRKSTFPNELNPYRIDTPKKLDLYAKELITRYKAKLGDFSSDDVYNYKFGKKDITYKIKYSEGQYISIGKYYNESHHESKYTITVYNNGFFKRSYTEYSKPLMGYFSKMCRRSWVYIADIKGNILVYSNQCDESKVHKSPQPSLNEKSIRFKYTELKQILLSNGYLSDLIKK